MILLVDDDFAYGEALRELLLSEDYNPEVIVLLNGHEAVEWVRTHTDQPPCVIVLDMMIPESEDDLNGGYPPDPNVMPHGVDVLKELCGTLKVAPDRIVVITALYRPNVAEELERLGVPRWQTLYKPAKVEDIMRLVKYIHNKHVGPST